MVSINESALICKQRGSLLISMTVTTTAGRADMIDDEDDTFL